MQTTATTMVLDVYTGIPRCQTRSLHEIGFVIDTNGNVLVTHIATQMRIVVLHRAFLRITGAHPRSIAGRFIVTPEVYAALGFVREEVRFDDDVSSEILYA